MPSLKWGRERENDAYEIYAQELAHCHPRFPLRKSGIIIGEPLYLGASPDGVLVDRLGHINGIVEMKFPAKLTTSCENLDKFCLYMEDGNFVLDRTHVYFYKVQESMRLLVV